MRASVKIEKSFDDTRMLSKEWQRYDFEEFFREEGQYLDTLCETTLEHGKDGEGYTVTYTVVVTK